MKGKKTRNQVKHNKVYMSFKNRVNKLLLLRVFLYKQIFQLRKSVHFKIRLLNSGCPISKKNNNKKHTNKSSH